MDAPQMEENSKCPVKKGPLKPHREKINPWMTVEILNPIEEVTKHETKDLNKYKEVEKNVRKKIWEGTERLLFDKYKETEDLDKRNGSSSRHKKIKRWHV